MNEDNKSKEYHNLLNALDDYFNMGVDKKKFISTDRIPLICQDISNIHNDISGIRDDVKGIQGDIKWGVKLIIGAVVAGFIALLFK